MKVSEAFPRVTCRRCGGGGKHSFNLRDLDVCYGCDGSGVVVARSAKPIFEEWRAANTAARDASPERIAVGDVLLLDAEARPVRLGKRALVAQYGEVVAVRSWFVEADPYCLDAWDGYHAAVTARLVDGAEVETEIDDFVCRQAAVDWRPYAERAWAKLGRQARLSVVNPEAEGLWASSPAGVA